MNTDKQIREQPDRSVIQRRISLEMYRLSDEERVILESLPSPLAVYQFVDRHIHVLAVSDGYLRMFGLEDRAEAYRSLEKNVFQNVHPDDVARMSEAMHRFIEDDSPFELIFRAENLRTQEYRIAHMRGEYRCTPEGVRLAYVWFADEGRYTGDDNTQEAELNRVFNRALHEESILQESHYDKLTGLPNMSHFFLLAEKAADAMRGQGKTPAILYTDFNGMKLYNERYGFAAGDRLLQGAARLLAQIFGKENCCHISADRFAVCAESEGLEEKLELLFRDAADLNGGNSLPVRAGIYPEGAERVPASLACDRAKMACDAAPKSDASVFLRFSDEMDRSVKRHRYILSMLDRAIEEKWIKVYYQPIIRAVNTKICDEEALARWIDPEEGFLSPADFIPTLEEARLIYKLDLFVLEQVLEKMKQQAARGLTVVPHSINLSRSDFDACDIVEEIRSRVDASGFPRDRITIEITESIIGGDFEFMKTQVERFRNLGFPVWMDDFGSGYSSLDVLQSIHFDLIKFDMSFMRKLDEGDSGKIILTQLMRMASSLSLDTVCEGVETESQVRFLQDIGCSKLQGYYFQKPLPFEAILEIAARGFRLGYENPEATAYYDAVGRVNLFDLDILADLKGAAAWNTFSTLPMGILEYRDGRAEYIRMSRSYRDFARHFFGFDAEKDQVDFENSAPGTSNFLKTVRQCCESGNRMFFDETMPDGTVVHQFIRRIGVNPVNGSTAVSITVLSISEPAEGATYADIVRALASDYYSIYVVDLQTDRYIEYAAAAEGGEMAVERRGEDFFEESSRNVMTRIYEEDREAFLASFSKENILRTIESHGVYTAIYRLIDTGTPQYASLKATRMPPHGNRVIMGISIIEAQMRQKEAVEKARRQAVVFGRMAALFGKMFALYTVDPETGRYFTHDITAGLDGLGFDTMGEDFFTSGIADGKRIIYPEDLPYFMEHFTKENCMREIRTKGRFRMRYRVVLNGEVKNLVLTAAMVKESDGEKMTVGVHLKEAE